MVRVIISALCLFSSGLFAEELVNGLITASQVDITADDGSLLPDRLNVGDVVYIVNKDGKDKKAGWVRVSKSPDDKLGVGWVEQKHIRTFSSYKDATGGGTANTATFSTLPDVPVIATPSQTPPPPTNPGLSGLEGLPFIPEDSSGSGFDSMPDFSSSPSFPATGVHKNVGVLRFTAQKNDAFVTSVSEYFSSAILKNSGLTGSALSDNAKSDSEAALQKIAEKHKVDGVFVGSVSDPMDDGRLVQVRFYSAKERKFMVEKVTRVPLKGDSKGMIESFAQSVVDQLNNPL